MRSPSEKPEKTCHRCPVCDAKSAIEPLPSSQTVPCPVCVYPLWCRLRLVDDVVMLDVTGDTVPEHADAVRLAKSLVGRGDIPRVIIDLSELDIVTSAFVARLVKLNTRIREAKGKLIVCGMNHFLVWDAFNCTETHKILDIVENEEAALASL